MSKSRRDQFERNLEVYVWEGVPKKDIYLYYLNFDFSVGDKSSERIPAWLKEQGVYSFFDLSEDNTSAWLSANQKLSKSIEKIFQSRDYINSFYFFGKV